MSLESLCADQTATIQRVVVTQGTAMGQTRNYTTAGRGSLPTTSTGRLQQLSDFRRQAYANKDVEIDSVWYTTTDPQVDNRDRLVIGGEYYFVHGQRNFDLQNRYWRVDLKKYGLGVQ